MKSKVINVPILLELDRFGNKTLWFNGLPIYQHDAKGRYTPGSGIDSLFDYIYTQQAKEKF